MLRKIEMASVVGVRVRRPSQVSRERAQCWEGQNEEPTCLQTGLQGGCCEVITEETTAALRKATKWAQSGLIVSVGPPVESVNPETVSGLSTGDKKKTAQTSICRERNSELAR